METMYFEVDYLLEEDFILDFGGMGKYIMGRDIVKASTEKNENGRWVYKLSYFPEYKQNKID